MVPDRLNSLGGASKWAASWPRSAAETDSSAGWARCSPWGSSQYQSCCPSPGPGWRRRRRTAPWRAPESNYSSIVYHPSPVSPSLLAAFPGAPLFTRCPPLRPLSWGPVPYLIVSLNYCLLYRSYNYSLASDVNSSSYCYLIVHCRLSLLYSYCITTV